MKPIAVLSAAVAILASTAAIAECQFGTTPQGRCVDRWGNIIPTDDERRYDENGLMRINLANEAAYFVDGRWYARPAQEEADRRSGAANGSTYGRWEGRSIDYSKRRP
jgi:hypothetical protein